MLAMAIRRFSVAGSSAPAHRMTSGKPMRHVAPKVPRAADIRIATSRARSARKSLRQSTRARSGGPDSMGPLAAEALGRAAAGIRNTVHSGVTQSSSHALEECRRAEFRRRSSGLHGATRVCDAVSSRHAAAERTSAVGNARSIGALRRRSQLGG